MSAKRPSQEEDEYFAREEAQRRSVAAIETRRALASAEVERLRALHHMKCPKCGHDLETVKFRGAAIDKCFHCNGTWLDAGELETLAGHDGNLFQKIAAVFKRD